MSSGPVADELTGRERVLAVLRGEEPDRVPTFEWDIDSGLIRRMTNGGTYEGFLDTYGLDAVICGPSYTRHPASNRRSIDEWGVTRARGLEDYAMPVDELAPIVSWSDLASWEPPDPHRPGRFERMRSQVARFKGKVAIFLRTRDVWSSPRELLGYTQLLIDCLDRPRLVDALVHKCVDHSIAIVRVAADLGAEVVITGDDIADSRGPLISPDLWASLFLPHFRRLVRAIHDCGLYYWKHTDGNITDLMDRLVDAGIDGIDPIDPLAGMDLASVKRRWGNRLAIKGNVDCVRTLTRGTEQEVVEAVKACIRTAGPGGGYVCSSSNSIHSGVKPELYKAMLAAVRAYGTYPLDMERLTPAEGDDA
jgi:uroporphyrinogen decarboxylase